MVYAADGRTPVARASVYVYQTDARGYYRPDDARGDRDPRLMALLRTDAAGGYSFTTVRPGSYPGTRAPRHIHCEVAAEATAPGSSRSSSRTTPTWTTSSDAGRRSRDRTTR